MARSEGSVVVRIIGEIRDLTAKLRQAGGSVGQFASSSRSAIRSSFDDIASIVTSRFGVVGREANRALTGIVDGALASGSAAGLGVAAGAVVGGAALVKMGADGIKKFSELGAEIRDFQRISGASAEDSSRMVAALRMLGVESKSAAGGLFNLSNSVERNADKLKADGVEIARNHDGTVRLLETLLNISDAYKKAGGAAEGNRIAFDAFGRSGATLVPILAAGRDRIEEFWAAAEGHGTILSQEDLERARELAVAQKELKEAVDGLEIALAKGLVPAFKDTVEGMSALIDTANKVTEPIGGLASVIEAGINVVSPATAIMGLFGRKTKDAGDAADDSALAQGDNAAAIEDVGDAAKDSADAVEFFSDALSGIRETTLGVADAQDDVNSSLMSLARESANAGREHEQALDRQRDAVQRLSDAEQSAADRISDAQDQVQDARSTAEKVNKPGQLRDEAYKRVAEAEKNLARTRRDADRDIAGAREDLADASRDVTAATDEWAPSLDHATEAGIRNRDVVGQIVEKSFKVAEEMKKQGRPASEINAYLETQRGLVDSILTKLGFAKSALQEYLDIFTRAVGANTFTGGGDMTNFSDAIPQVQAILKAGLGGPVTNINVNVDSPDARVIAEEVARQVDRTLRRRG